MFLRTRYHLIFCKPFPWIVHWGIYYQLGFHVWSEIAGSNRGRSRGRVQLCAPPAPSWDDLRFSNTTGILQQKTMWFICVQLEQETSAPPPKKESWIRPWVRMKGRYHLMTNRKWCWPLLQISRTHFQLMFHGFWWPGQLPRNRMTCLRWW